MVAGPCLPDVPEVFALVWRLGGGFDVLQLRRDLINLFRLVLELAEGDLESEVFREDVQDGVRVVEPPETEEQSARADNPSARFPAGEHDAILLHLLHEFRARRGSEDP